MLRKEKCVTDWKSLHTLIKKCQVMRLGLAKENQPYLVPLSFGFNGQYIYFHTARKGLKIDYLQANPEVCFEFEDNVSIIPHQTTACNWSFSFQSIIGFGKAEELLALKEKINALEYIMRQYSGKDWHFAESGVDSTRVWRIVISSMTGKQSPDLLQDQSII